MLGFLFLLSAAVLAASWFRRPVQLWHKVATGVALVTLLAVLVAWGIEAVLTKPLE